MQQVSIELFLTSHYPFRYHLTPILKKKSIPLTCSKSITHNLHKDKKPANIKKRDDEKYQYTRQDLVQGTETFQGILSTKGFCARNRVFTKLLERLQMLVLSWGPGNDF